MAKELCTLGTDQMRVLADQPLQDNRRVKGDSQSWIH